MPWAIFQLGLISVFVLLAFGRRSGPLYAPAAVSRLSPLEFVDTLGDLYRRASAGPAAVRVAYQRFRTQLLRRLALAPSISNMQLDAAVRERLGWKQPGLMDTLQRAEKAAREKRRSRLGRAENCAGARTLRSLVRTEDATQRGETLSGKSRTPHDAYSHRALEGHHRAAGNCRSAFDRARLRRPRPARRRPRPGENAHGQNAGADLRRSDFSASSARRT